MAFAVLLATVMSSLQAGSYELMVANMAGKYTGYLQVHDSGYWQDKTLEHSFAAEKDLETKLLGLPKVKAVIPRLEGFALASSGEHTLGAMVIGVDPEKENTVTGLRERVSTGRYLQQGDQGVLVAEGLAKQLGLRSGDTLYLLSQGYHGATAAGRFVVAGLAHFGSPELNAGLVYLDLQAARRFYAAEGRNTAWVVQPEALSDLDEVRHSVSSAMANRKDLEVMDWTQMLPDLKQAITADRAGGVLMMGVLYLIISFGIFSTLLMMAYERRHEFGVLIAIGMRKGRLATLVFLESIFLGGLGVLTGLVASSPIVYWLVIHPLRFSGQAAEAYVRFGIEPVFPAVARLSIFLREGFWVWLVAALLALVPVYRVLRLNTLEAMRR